jgi:predicted transposase/invertase (TIGR01784 family)
MTKMPLDFHGRLGPLDGSAPIFRWQTSSGVLQLLPVIPHIDPKVDYAFKRIFGYEANAPVLIDLINAVLQRHADRRMVEVMIENPFNDKERWDDKLSIVDIKARDQAGRRYHIEMQMHATLTYADRVLYYWAKIFGSQLAQTDDYGKLTETISISFLNDLLFPEVPDYHLDFQLRSSRHPTLIFSDRQEIHIIELPKFGKSAEELAGNIEAWCFFLRNAADLDSDSLPKAMQSSAVAQAMEVLNVISKTDLERERYEARVRFERDQRSNLNEAREEGHAKGLQEGVKQGVISRIHLCQRLLKVPLTPAEELSNLTTESLEEMAVALQKQLGAI